MYNRFNRRKFLRKQQLKTVRVFMIIAAIVFLLSPFSSFAGALDIDKACVQGGLYRCYRNNSY